MKKSKSGPKDSKGGASPSHLIDARIAALTDWRGETLARVRKLIREADPEIVEEVKWRKPSNAMLGVPVWEHDGIVCTGETYKNVVKLTFAHGASLEDPSGLFNASLEGGTRRAIDIREGDKIDEKAFKALIRAAVALNTRAATARPAGSQEAKERLKRARPFARIAAPQSARTSSEATMKSILGVSLLILLMPSAYAAELPGDSADGSACMTLTAWDATILASTPARTDAFGL